MLALFMASERTTVVDFVAKASTPDEWKMVLVEQGPWLNPIDDQLRRIQERMYGCVDAALDGKLAEKFPESKGKRVIVQLDCYDLPKVEVQDFFQRFSNGIFDVGDYRTALEKNQFVRGIGFEINFDHIH